MDAEQGAAAALSSAQARAVDALIRAKEVSQEKVKQAAAAVDSHVHKNPWPYIGGAAVGSLLLGYILGRKGKD